MCFETHNSLTLSDKLVLVVLIYLIPHQEKNPILLIHIANISGVSPRTVKNSLRRLRSCGIVVTKRPHPGIPYIYSVNKDKIPQFDESSLITLLHHQY